MLKTILFLSPSSDLIPSLDQSFSFLGQLALSRDRLLLSLSLSIACDRVYTMAIRASFMNVVSTDLCVFFARWLCWRYSPGGTNSD